MPAFVFRRARPQHPTHQNDGKKHADCSGCYSELLHRKVKMKPATPEDIKLIITTMSTLFVFVVLVVWIGSRLEAKQKD
jgi:hypothetical protein